MKKNNIILGSILTTSILSLNCDISMAEQPQYITTTRLHMRIGPSTSYSIVGTLDKNQKITILEKSDTGNWGKIKYNSRYVWVSLNYLKEIDNTTPNNKPLVQVGKIYKTRYCLNARLGPSTDYRVGAILKSGQTVKPLSIVSNGEWAKINYNGKNLYVSTSYLELVKDDESNTGDGNTDDTQIDEKYVTKVNLNLRTESSVSSPIVLTIPQGKQVIATSISSDKQWLKVKYNDVEGWLNLKYLIKYSDINTPVEDKKYLYCTTNLNFRISSSVNSERLCIIPKSSKVLLLSYNSDKTWANIEYKNLRGWVTTKYLQEKELELEEDYYYAQTISNLNLRRGKSTSDSIITTIPSNSKVKVYYEENGWAKIKYNSYVGYCSSLYLK